MADGEKKQPQKNLFWPAITDLESATQASDAGYAAALVVAGITAIFATIAAFSGSALGGINAWAYVDAAIFAVIAWRIRKRSRAFAVIGLLFFMFEKIVQISDGPPPTGSMVMAVFLMCFFISGVRGTFAVHRFKDQPVAPVAGTDA